MVNKRTKSGAPDELADLFPGTSIEIYVNETKSIKIGIRPMPIIHFRKFKTSITRALDKLNKNGGESLKLDTMILPLVAEIAADELMDIVNECVDGIDLTSDYCPQWIFPEIVKVWIFESFGSEKKLRPWIDLLDEILNKVTKQKVGLWDQLTQHLSNADGQSQKSTNSV